MGRCGNSIRAVVPLPCVPLTRSCAAIPYGPESAGFDFLIRDCKIGRGNTLPADADKTSSIRVPGH